MNGCIVRRGKKSWRIKYDTGRDPETGARKIAYVTTRGNRADAEKELRKRLYSLDKGTHVDPARLTVAEYLNDWLDNTAPASVGPKALERYRELVRNQIEPRLGKKELQKLRPADAASWLQALRRTGLSARSIRHAHGVLRTALAHAAAVELVERNVATVVKPPKATKPEIQILTADQIADVLGKLRDHAIYPIVALAIGTGARRGEIAALTWGALDLDGAAVTFRQSLEQTKAGLRVKAPKTTAGRRTVSLPAFVVEVLREHRKRTLELRLALGAGALPADAPVFGDHEGNWPNPYSMSDRWRDLVRSRKLPKVTLHALRHSHASALIAAGLDVVSISRRLGHASPALTLSTYAHLFANTDDRAAAAIDAALGGNTR